MTIKKRIQDKIKEGFGKYGKNTRTVIDPIIKELELMEKRIKGIEGLKWK